MLRSPARRFLFPAVGLLPLTFLGCSYGFSSRTTAGTGIETIAIRPFDNRTRQPNIEIALWELVVDLFDRDRLLKVVEEESADSILEAVVATYRNDPISIDTESLGADEYRVTLVLEASFYRTGTNEEVWKKQRFQGDGKYFLEGEDVTWEDALEEAASEIVQDLLNRMIGDW